MTVYILDIRIFPNTSRRMIGCVIKCHTNITSCMEEVHRWWKNEEKTKNAFYGNKVFMHATGVHSRRKVGLENSGWCQDASIITWFKEFVKWTWKLNCDGGKHQRPQVCGEKLPKWTKTAERESADGRWMSSNKSEMKNKVGHFTVDTAARKITGSLS